MGDVGEMAVVPEPEEPPGVVAGLVEGDGGGVAVVEEPGELPGVVPGLVVGSAGEVKELGSGMTTLGGLLGGVKLEGLVGAGSGGEGFTVGVSAVEDGGVGTGGAVVESRMSSEVNLSFSLLLGSASL